MDDAASSSLLEDMPSLELAKFSWRGRWSAKALPPSLSAVGIARTEAELEAIGRLRYEFDLACGGKAYAHADHVRRRLVEPVDDVSLNFQAVGNGRVLAATRVTWAEDALTDSHQRRVVQSALPDCLSTTLVMSRFAVRPNHCAGATILEMLREIYRTGLASGARSCLVAPSCDLVDMLEQFGFCRIGLQIADPFADQIHILNMDFNADTRACAHSGNADVVSSSKTMRNPARPHIDLARYAFPTLGA